MDISLTTPSLLFPAISLLMLAYTNRFLALAAVIRNLDASYRSQRNGKHLAEIRKLRWRLRRIRDMQFFGVLSLLLCTTCMFLLFQGWVQSGKWVFGLSLMAMITSLIISLIEIQRSSDALDIHLSDLEEDQAGPGRE